MAIRSMRVPYGSPGQYAPVKKKPAGNVDVPGIMNLQPLTAENDAARAELAASQPSGGLAGYIRQNPEILEGLYGAIMGIPGKGGFLEGLQGTMGGYAGGVERYRRGISAKEEEAAKRAKEAQDAEFERQRLELQGEDVQTRRGQLMQDWYQAMNPKPAQGRMTPEEWTAMAKARLEYLKGLPPGDREYALGRVPRAQGASETQWRAKVNAVKAVIPGISEEDAVLIASYNPTLEQTQQVLRRPTLDEAKEKGAVFITETPRVYRPHPLVGIALRKYGVDPQKFYNSSEFQPFVIPESENGTGEGDEEDTSWIENLEDEGALITIGADPTTSRAEYETVVARLTELHNLRGEVDFTAEDAVALIDEAMATTEPIPSHRVTPGAEKLRDFMMIPSH